MWKFGVERMNFSDLHLIQKLFLGLFGKQVIWTLTGFFKNNQSFVYIDFCSTTEGTEADSPFSSSHAMHQNNWQYPIILWSVYRRSDGPPENKSVIRKPRVWITDVMPAGHNGDKIGQRENGEKRKMGSCFSLFYIKCHIGIQAQEMTHRWQVKEYVV